jgi:hypothetical protein
MISQIKKRSFVIIIMLFLLLLTIFVGLSASKPIVKTVKVAGSGPEIWVSTTNLDVIGNLKVTHENAISTDLNQITYSFGKASKPIEISIPICEAGDQETYQISISTNLFDKGNVEFSNSCSKVVSYKSVPRYVVLDFLRLSKCATCDSSAIEVTSVSRFEFVLSKYSVQILQAIGILWFSSLTFFAFKTVRVKGIRELISLTQVLMIHLGCITLVLVLSNGVGDLSENASQKTNTVSLSHTNGLTLDHLEIEVPKGFYKTGYTNDLFASGKFFLPSQFSRPEKNERRTVFDFGVIKLEVNSLNQISLIAQRGYFPSQSEFTRETLEPGEHDYRIELIDSRKLTMYVDEKIYISSFSYKPVYWVSTGHEDIEPSASNDKFFISSSYLNSRDKFTSAVEVSAENERAMSVSYAMRWFSLWFIGISVFFIVFLVAVSLSRKTWEKNNDSFQ